MIEENQTEKSVIATALSYFNHDQMSADVWKDKYAMKNGDTILENTPADMHRRMAKEFAKVEYKYVEKEISRVNTDTSWHESVEALSQFGQRLFNNRNIQSLQDIEDEIFSYFDKFSRIVPQGSIMSNLGNPYVFGSLSNCFGVEPPLDSYGGILKTDQELAQLMKRRGGAGTHLNNLRPAGAAVSNAAKSATGVESFAERFSNTTREVAQGGRRGALMLLLSCKHPSIFKFVTMKDDRTKVTGANVTVMFTDEFMEAVENKDDRFYCTFPVEVEIDARYQVECVEFNKLYDNIGYKKVSIMKIHAKELFGLVADMACKNGEPGVAFIDRIQDYCPDGVYEIYMPTLCNPCGEQWFSPDETCRLIAQNFFTIVDNPFTDDAKVNLEKLYEQSYMQQRLGDDLVDLEVEYIDRILDKLHDDPEPINVKRTEIELWKRIKTKAKEGRRTGGGFTGLGDMFAALNVGYASDEGLQIAELVMKTKMEAELDATIDMAILRGPFTGWDVTKEYLHSKEYGNSFHGANAFFEMLILGFTDQVYKMAKYGRRNISWSTVAPTGTVSLLTQTTSGLEPLFKAYYIRRKKIVPGVGGVRVDFVDQSGDSWMEYPVLHPKFKDWLKDKTITSCVAVDNCTEIPVDLSNASHIKLMFANSPWYGSEADDISWERRIMLQAIIQRYTTNAISSTINLHKDTTPDVIKNIYMAAYKSGLKGITVYRDGSRSGVLINEPVSKVGVDEFGYTDAPKRPKLLDADYHFVNHNGRKYAVIVGKLNGNPYELFTFAGPLIEEDLSGNIIKIKSGVYKFMSGKYGYVIENLQMNSDHKEEVLLTRWVSLALRHGANPRFIAGQVEKVDINVTSFAKVIARVLKTYVPDSSTKERCPNCQQETVIYEEGCKKCSSCGHSKC